MNKNQQLNRDTLYCSFCGKSQHAVKKLIAGPTVFICDECVELCDDIIAEEKKSPEAVAAENELVKKAREWLTQTHWSEQQKACEERCNMFDARVDAGHFDQDPRVLGYINGLKAVEGNQ